MNNIDYTKLFSIQEDIENVLKTACPEIDNQSGIYFLIRKENDKKYIYVGQAKCLLTRMVSHMQGYKQRIDISLRKRGLHSEHNKGGWKLNILHFPLHQLNAMEQLYIKSYKEAGYELYNVESGGKTGKTDINGRKSAVGYQMGLKQGYKNAQKEIANWFDKSLDYSIKGKPNKNKQKAYDKFTKFIEHKNGE